MSLLCGMACHVTVGQLGPEGCWFMKCGDKAEVTGGSVLRQDICWV